MNFWGVFLGHVGLKVDKAAVDLVGQDHTLSSVKIGFRYLVFLVAFNRSLKLRNGLPILASFCKDQSDQIEHHGIRLRTLIEALIEIFQS